MGEGRRPGKGRGTETYRAERDGDLQRGVGSKFSYREPKGGDLEMGEGRRLRKGRETETTERRGTKIYEDWKWEGNLHRGEGKRFRDGRRKET